MGFGQPPKEAEINVPYFVILLKKFTIKFLKIRIFSTKKAATPKSYGIISIRKKLVCV